MKTPTLLLVALLSISCASASSAGKAPVTPRSGEGSSSEAAEPRPSDGSFEGGTYSNRFFGFRIAPPEGWSVASPEEDSVIAETGRELITGDDERKRAVARASAQRTTNLLTISRYPIGTPGKANAALQLVAEYVPFAGVADGVTYLEIVREIVKQAAAGDAYEPQEEIGRTTIDGREFATLLFRVDLNGQVIWQSYRARKDNLHVLVCIMTWQSESDGQELEKLLASLRFS